HRVIGATEAPELAVRVFWCRHRASAGLRRPEAPCYALLVKGRWRAGCLRRAGGQRAAFLFVLLPDRSFVRPFVRSCSTTGDVGVQRLLDQFTDLRFPAGIAHDLRLDLRECEQLILPDVE